MNISLNWLKDYLQIDLEVEQVGEVLTEIGLEVEGLEKVESIAGVLAGVVVGHVLECGQHPNADRLSLTKVDVGAAEPLQIVCGAPNVAKGQKVLVATVGTTLHPLKGEPFKIKKGKIRGEASVGMICAEDELGLGDDHDGIIVLAEDTKVGTPASEVFELETDYVYEIGLTPNRSDATNHIGVAKDLGAALKINYQHSGEVQMPDVSGFKVDHTNATIEVEVRNTEACPRYAGVCITDLKIAESPDWLKNRLKAVGVRPINNVVDATNFILHELGQPLHAFDLEKITDQKIIVETLPEGSIFKSLDEVDRKLLATDLMICDGAEKGMCIGGVFGGIDSGVTDGTTSIFLESAHFHPKYIRHSSMHHNLRTDAAKVFEKGSDPNICVYALKRAALLMQELAGGTIASEIVDIYPEKVEKVEITLTYEHVNTIIGVEIPKAKIHAILDALEMDITHSDDTNFSVKVPTNKADVLRPADVIEEILRIYGLNAVPVSNRISMSLSYGESTSKQAVRDTLGDLLAANGFIECMSLSLSQSKYYEDILPMPKEQLAFIHNTSNVHLDIMRPTMLFSTLETIVHNQNRQQMDLKLFEFGRTYTKDEAGQFEEAEHLSISMTGQRWAESWLMSEQQTADFFSLKAFVQNVLGRVGINSYQESPVEDGQFAYGLKFHRGQQTIVCFGKVNAKVTKAMGVKTDVFYADFMMNPIFKAAKKAKIQIAEPVKFPSSRRDLALVVAQSIKFQDIATLAQKAGKKLLKSINLFDVYEDEERLGEGKKSYAISLQFEDATKTLKDKEIDKIVNKLIQQYEQQLGAVIRR
ncbi:MAG: phenylalanine--tRNA ligase subunit beta, partial [Bacteroidota bacterium]